MDSIFKSKCEKQDLFDRTKSTISTRRRTNKFPMPAGKCQLYNGAQTIYCLCSTVYTSQHCQAKEKE